MKFEGSGGVGVGGGGGTNDVTNYGSCCRKDVVSLYLQLPGRTLA